MTHIFISFTVYVKMIFHSFVQNLMLQ